MITAEPGIFSDNHLDVHINLLDQWFSHPRRPRGDPLGGAKNRGSSFSFSLTYVARQQEKAVLKYVRETRNH